MVLGGRTTIIDTGRRREGPDVNEVIAHKLYVGNLHRQLTEAALLNIVMKYGDIRKYDYMYNHLPGPDRGKPRGYAFVEYTTREAAEEAMRKLHGKKAFGRPLRVKFVSGDSYYYLSETEKEKDRKHRDLEALGLVPKTDVGVVSSDNDCDEGKFQERSSLIQSIEAKIQLLQDDSTATLKPTYVRPAPKIVGHKFKRRYNKPY